ncbi:LysM peptidoglycan-binding domain-containing protein [Kribbella amoyensis]|uniref:LysM peptidoglycan-binding domain-containing protein n=1 Tax=Kribbella amoyensis TaxID=996641 RepID=UPI0011A413D9|nr:LysM domain-containing protein [Kribbella amoyensis]
MKALLALGALTALGLLLRWMTGGMLDAASVEDLPSMAFVTVGVVAWFAYAWLLLAVLATVLEQLPGALGSAASAIAGTITSHGSRALLRSALGVAAVTPLTIGVAHATPADAPNHRAWGPVESPSTLALGDSTQSAANWRTTEQSSTIRLTDSARTPGATSANWRTTESPSTVRLTEPARRSTASPADWRAQESASTVRLTETPTAPDPKKSRVAIPAPTRPTEGDSTKPTTPGRGDKPSTARRVGVPDRPTVGAPTRYTDLGTGRVAGRVVATGESLWSIAAGELGPQATNSQIDARWRQWYAANRAVIGSDPDLIRSGQVLRTPAPAAPAVPQTHEEK